MVNCDCSISIDDYADAEFSFSKTVQAHTEHKCCECGGTIHEGEHYECCTGKWEGEIETWRTCSLCARIRKDFCPNGWVYGGLQTQLWECLGVDYITGQTTNEEQNQ